MITADEIKALEDKAVEKGTSKLDLMENAGKQIAEVLKKKDLKGKRILVAAYHGNNGGDGFVAARELAATAEVEVLFIGEEESLKSEAEINLRRLEHEHVVQFITLEFIDFDDYDIIIDALLGTGIEGSLRPRLQSTINAINSTKAYKVSIDVPSGLNPDTGKVDDISVNADLIISLHDLKKGLKDLKEKTVVVDIGIPK